MKSSMDEDQHEGSSYFMEVYDRIRSLDIVLRGDDHPKSLEVHPKEVVVKKSDGSEDKYPLVMEAEPSTCTAVNSHLNEGVGIRLQMRESNPEPQTGLLSTSVKRVGSELSRMERGACQCGCKTCGLTLFRNNVKFNRVLPLPSQSWRDLFTSWTCCTHASSQTDVSKTSMMGLIHQKILRPREGDCLVSDFHIYVHATAINRRNVLLMKSNGNKDKQDFEAARKQNVRCARCRADMGEILFDDDSSINAFKFSKNNIEILSLRKHMAETVVRPVFFSEFFLERLLAQRLAMSVHTHACHMLVIQDQEGKPYLLIRVLNTNTRLFVNNGATPVEFNEQTRDFTTQLPKSAVSDTTHHCATGDSNSVAPKSLHCDDTATPSGGMRRGENPRSDTDKIRRDGPPRFHGNKVAEVIEKLFSFSTHLISIGRTCNEIRSADPTGCERIVKVMYASTHVPAFKQLAAKWAKEDRAMTLSYPRQVCVQMLLVLVSSTLTMPVAHRVVDDYMVGFLRLD